MSLQGLEVGLKQDPYASASVDRGLTDIEIHAHIEEEASQRSIPVTSETSMMMAG